MYRPWGLPPPADKACFDPPADVPAHSRPEERLPYLRKGSVLALVGRQLGIMVASQYVGSKTLWDNNSRLIIPFSQCHIKSAFQLEHHSFDPCIKVALDMFHEFALRV